MNGAVIAATAFLQKIVEDGPLVADIMGEALRDESIATALRASDVQSIRILAEAIVAAQARGEVDTSLDPEKTADTLFAMVEGIGLRRAFNGATDTEAALAQFRAVAERYLAPPPRDRS